MIIYDLDLLRTVCCPPETDSKLVVDANAVLTFPVADEEFETISGRSTKELQRFRGIELHELPNGNPCNRSESPASSALKQCPRVGATESANHPLKGISCIGTRQTRRL
jgi:hypothetical protein